MLSTKITKIISVIMLAVMLTITVSNVAMAATDFGTIISSTENKINRQNDANVQDIGGRIIGFIQVLGVVAAVIVLVWLGVKYITASPEGKADYKGALVPYVIGAILLALGPTIAAGIFNAITKTNVS